MKLTVESPVRIMVPAINNSKLVSMCSIITFSEVQTNEVPVGGIIAGTVISVSLLVMTPIVIALAIITRRTKLKAGSRNSQTQGK